MKLLFLALLAIGAPLVVVAARAQTAVSPDALPMAPKSAATADAFVWRFAPPVGSRWTMRSFKRAVSVSPDKPLDNPRPYTITSVQRLTADYDVLSRDSLGAITIRLTYHELSERSTFSSDGITGELKRPNEGYEKFVDGATLTIKQGPDGSVWSVVGAHAFLRRVLQTRGVTNDKILRQALDSMKSYEKGVLIATLVETLNRRSSVFPPYPMRVGESWNYSTNFPDRSLDIPDIEANGARTLKALDSKFALITESARFDGADPKQELPDLSKVDVDYSQLKGMITGTEHIERSSGLSLETNISTTLKGRILAKVREQNGAFRPVQDISVNTTWTTSIVLQPR